MDNRIVSESSSSTSGQIRKFIQNTHLSDSLMHPPRLPAAHSSSLSISRGKQPSANQTQHKSTQDNELPESPEMFEYHKKLKYLPNKEFNPETISKSFHLSSYSPVNSIPNTFKYKSHPNAKTKKELRQKPTSSTNEDSNMNKEQNSNKDDELKISEEKTADLENSDNAPQEQNDDDSDQYTSMSSDHEDYDPHSEPKNSTFISKADTNNKNNISNPNPNPNPNLNPNPNSNANNKNKNTDKNNNKMTGEEVEIKSSSAHEKSTPNWMPEVLDEKWLPPSSLRLDNINDEFSSSVKINRSGKDFDLNLHTSADTLIHNSQAQAHETPEWARASKAYEAKKSKPDWQNIFYTGNGSQDYSLGNSNKSVRKSVSTNGNNSISTSASSPFPSFETDKKKVNAAGISPHIIQNQVQQTIQKNLAASRNPESPLKLFHDKYNTFTKDRLYDILQKVQNDSPLVSQLENANDTQNPSKEVSMPKLPDPKLRIKNFTKGGAYTEHEFLKNADDVFKNVQQRFKNRKTSMRDVTNLNPDPKNKQGSIFHEKPSTSTSTSTPINMKVENISDMVDNISDEYSSYTSGLDDENESLSQPLQSTNSVAQTTNNDYTSFGSSSMYNENLNQLSPKNLERLQKQLSAEEDNYTYDDTSERNHFDQIVPNEMDELVGRLEKLEIMVQSSTEQKLQMEKLIEENNALKEELVGYKYKNAQSSPNHIDDVETGMDSYNTTNIDDVTHLSQFIKWKKPSQLVLGKSPDNTRPGKSKRHSNESPLNVYKGRVEPGIDLPLEYENMIFDPLNKKWISNDDKHGIDIGGGSLDSIEDLITQDESEFEKRKSPNNPYGTLSSALRGSKGSTSKMKQEVSFHLPNSTSESLDSYSFEEKKANVTNVSQLQDSTFSQTKKKLVNIITDILQDITNWDRITQIDLSEQDLENIKELDEILPGLRMIDASNNKIKFLDGLSKRILHLNVSHNCIETIASFEKLRDLQFLDLSFNGLSSLSSIQNNIHITELICTDNKLSDLNGIRIFSNLIRLNVSRNNISGCLDFSNFNLRNLQELNVSENSLTSIVGIENLDKLRVLNANENQLQFLSCKEKHTKLKKLLIKCNQIKELDLSFYPNLRILRIDGNKLHSFTNLNKLNHLEELSCKSQYNLKCIEQVMSSTKEISRLDLSGNQYYFKEFSELTSNTFLNISSLTLTAMNISTLPNNFSRIFPNLRELNLNFNKIKSIEALSGLKYLRKVYLISNGIDKVGSIVNGLSQSRKCLKVLDLRLNPINVGLYPYVFNQQELEYSQYIKATTKIDISPIPLESLDDIESFAILYQSLNKSQSDWQERDSKFLQMIQNDSTNSLAQRRMNYETLIINLFYQLKFLDGGEITQEKRSNLKQLLYQHTK